MRQRVVVDVRSVKERLRQSMTEVDKQIGSHLRRKQLFAETTDRHDRSVLRMLLETNKAIAACMRQLQLQYDDERRPRTRDRSAIRGSRKN